MTHLSSDQNSNTACKIIFAESKRKILISVKSKCIALLLLKFRKRQDSLCEEYNEKLTIYLMSMSIHFPFNFIECIEIKKKYTFITEKIQS